MKKQVFKRVKRIDRLARWIISLGGIAIIVSMVLMVVFMLRVALPLLHPPRAQAEGQIAPSGPVAVFGVGPRLAMGFSLSTGGDISVVDIAGGGRIESGTHRLLPESPEAPARIVDAQRTGKDSYSFLWEDGTLSGSRILFEPHYLDDGAQNWQLVVGDSLHMPLPEGVATHWSGVLRFDGHSKTQLRWDQGKRLFFHRIQSGPFASETEHWLTTGTDGDITDATLTADGRFVFVGTSLGELVAWDMSLPQEPKQTSLVKAFGGHRAISSLALLYGDVTLVAGNDTGDLSAWNLQFSRQTPTLVQIRAFVSHQGAVREILSSFRDKSFVVRDAEGNLCIHHLTTGARLLGLDEHGPYDSVQYAQRGDGLVARDAQGRFHLWKLEIPHPEVSLSTLWGKVWYESYPEPDLVWQSSAAVDHFEPKLSLVPLIFGSLKGTFYGMLFSLPLAFFAALYVSHIMHPRWRAFIKPMVELMAAVPTVVIGFLAALWLAPRLEGNLLAVVFALATVPVVVGTGMLSLFKRNQKVSGREFLWAAPMVLVGVYLAYQLGLAAQSTYFGGNLNLWLYQNLGLHVDQRNCVVIAFALGFAVIPIIFTISEDAMHNVPQSLTAAALALGSSRWQTVRRVVLPMASPGIFAAAMIGFGRAVGETMIVLMATGNTPIMSPSILNGMRTLSANIAVEIPEAPVDGTLYRVLFLSALILFALTFVINTLAEVVRVKLNRRFQNL